MNLLTLAAAALTLPTETITVSIKVPTEEAIYNLLQAMEVDSVHFLGEDLGLLSVVRTADGWRMGHEFDTIECPWTIAMRAHKEAKRHAMEAALGL
jgi:hypothetical protein